MNEFDVTIVGYGPVGKLLAKLLLDRGYTVAVVERWPSDYPLPRAVGFYHDIYRMFHALKWNDIVDEVSSDRPGAYNWYSADWDLLISILRPEDSLSGGPNVRSFNQPELERKMNAELERFANITYFRGYEAESVSQDENAARVVIRKFDVEANAVTDDAPIELVSKYVAGCDGANSLVARTIDTRNHDFGFDKRWLVVDIEQNGGVPDDFEPSQWCNPERPTTVVAGGRTIRRWEFQLKDDETAEQVTNDDFIWELVSPWMKPEDGVMVRKAIYNFRGLIADRWRDRRLVLAGDACHRTPPFLGQGMCSGMRDAWDLAWQLDLVLSGLAPDALLDTYQAARLPHVGYFIEKAIELGRILCEEDPEKAALRDAALKSGGTPPPPTDPDIISGLLSRDDSFKPTGAAGKMVPHVHLVKDGATRRMDDVTGRNFAVISLVDFEDALSPEQRDFLDTYRVARIRIGEGGYSEVEGKIAAFLEKHGAKALIVRPDFHAFGTADSAAGVGRLVDQLRFGIACPVPHTVM